MTLRSGVMGTASDRQRAMIADLRGQVAPSVAAVEAADKALADPNLDTDAALRVIQALQKALPRIMDTGSGPGYVARQ